MKKLRNPRFIQKLYAKFAGYFWLPCPICRRMFGGHEIAEATLIKGYPGTKTRKLYTMGQAVCVECNDEAMRRNKLFFEKHYD